MPFQIIRDDITRVHADAIVKTTYPEPVCAGRTVHKNYMTAVADKLLNARKKTKKIPPGEAELTPASGFAAEYIIHTAGPVWIDGRHGEEETLRSCYRRSLYLALKKNCESIAFPLISTDTYGFPHKTAVRAAVKEISDFILVYDMMVYLVCGEKAADFLCSAAPEKKTYFDVESVKLTEDYEYPTETHDLILRERRKPYDAKQQESGVSETPKLNYNASILPSAAPPAAPSAAQRTSETFSFRNEQKKRSLKDVIAEVDATFQQTVLRIMEEKNMKPSVVYHAANLKKQHWAKIKADENYQPRRNTAICICLALQLNLDEAKDLLAKAGYAFSPAKGEDLLVMECIRNKNFNIVDIEMQLYDYHLPQLCQYPE